MVDANERKINQGLGLTDEAQIGIRSDGQDFYVTRTFKANTDPKYLAEVIDAIKGKGKKNCSLPARSWTSSYKINASCGEC